MPSPNVADLDRFAVLWAKVGYDRYGSPAVSPIPLEIPVRWVETLTESMGGDDNTQSWDVQFATDRDIPIGSVLWLGRLKDLPIGNKIPTTGIHEVKMAKTAMDVKGREIRCEGGAMRLKDKLPTFAP